MLGNKLKTSAVNIGPEFNPMAKKSRFGKSQVTMAIGLAVLAVSLVAGLVFFSKGTGVFAPRATPETTPKNVQVSNVSDKGFTVSFVTAEKVPGFIKYGEEPDKLKTQVGDERDQLTGTVGKYQLHYITVGGLKPNTTYYFTLGTASKSSFDDNGKPFQVKTAKKATTPPAAKTIYGNLVKPSGTPPKEGVVYVKVEGAGLLSSLMKKSGTWAIPLSNARLIDGSGYAQITDDSLMVLIASSPEVNKSTTINTTVGEFENGTTITLGQANNTDKTASPNPTLTPTLKISTTPPTQTASPSPTIKLSPTITKKPLSGGLGSLLKDATHSASASTSLSGTLKTEIDLTKEEDKVVHTTQPKIKGEAKPKVKVKISIHSNNQIDTEVTADENGEFQVDIAALSAQLEPGEHTIEYTYIDPETGEEVTKVETFVVADPNQPTDQLAQANTDTNTSSTNNPYDYNPSPTNTPTPTQASTSTSTYGTDYPYSSETEASESASLSANLSPTPTKTASPSTLPATGIFDVTLLTIIGGLFFILVGGWSFWIALELEKNNR